MIRVAPRVAAALASSSPVVALESTVIAHGLPRPTNLEMATLLEARLDDMGVVPATVGVVDGEVVVGMAPDEIARIAAGGDVSKVSMRDLAAVSVAGALGATTVATTMWAAARTGVRVMATGGIGGVHRGAGSTFDVSADMGALATNRVAVVCSGAKSVLDIPKTLEVLESLGVPVVGYRTHEFPAFYSRSSRLPLDHVVTSARHAAEVIRAHAELGLSSGIVFANPVPEAEALPAEDAEALVSAAVAAASDQGVEGKDLTPFLLAFIADGSAGRSLQANLALLESNTIVAGEIAAALA
ncbi:MAG TPA: pseudouridine-5'-phosphate glycosidase [Acidimicrobiia bacterium]|jgi:pseudouridine-5'-phosphate glycosidase